VERALGKVPNVEKVHWDWQEGVVYVRFTRDGHPGEDVLRRAVDEGTAYTSGNITYYDRIEGLPDALR